MTIALPEVAVDASRLAMEIDTLATYSAAEPPAVTRIVFSDEDRAARGYLRDLFSEGRLQIREDAVGNTFARWVGKNPDLPPVATGSHIDAIPHSGRYDGTVGVLGALEAIRALQASGFQPLRSIELILFTAEEPTRFGIGCLGSRLLSGSLTGEDATKLQDPQGRSIDELRQASGVTGDLTQVSLAPGHFSSFVEMHIEQGPLLEREGLSIGIVESIAAPASLRLVITGEGGHAGTVLMPDRRDAFMAATEMALALESSAKSSGSSDTVATIGTCELFPGAINSIPSRVQAGIDLRDTDGQRRNRVLESFLSRCEEIAERRHVSMMYQILNSDPPAKCSPEILSVIRNSCTALSVSHRGMVSRAYHDSLFMARIAPTAMIFIPCRKGVSHRPDEYAAPEDMARGAQVLALALAQLSGDTEVRQ